MKQNRNSSPPTSLDHEKRLRALENKGGGGDNGDMGDAWREMVGSRLDRVDGDLRQLWWATVGSFLFLILAFGTGWLNIDGRLDSSDKTLVKIEGRLDGIEKTLSKIETKLP